jgi:hypothetical protein
MSPAEYKKQILDTKSKSFCGAKYYLASLWLHTGTNASCYHNRSHKIDVNEILTNPKALHNTPQKKQERQLMREGVQPTGCEFCWTIENSLSENNLSDRVWNSAAHTDDELLDAFNSEYDRDFNLIKTEVTFDRTCQFACSYCGPWLSTTWAKDIKTNGNYVGLDADKRQTYANTGEDENMKQYKFGEANPYTDAFLKWWETDLYKTLEELRISGGEPFMSGNFWKLIDWFATNTGKSNTRLAINSNLGYPTSEMDKFFNKLNGYKNIVFHVSAEAFGAKGEYVRDGLKWEQWVANVDKLLDAGVPVETMGTLSAPSVDGLVEYLDFMIPYKKKYGNSALQLSIQPVIHPVFQNIFVLPTELSQMYKTEIESWYNNPLNSQYLTVYEHENIKRFITYLDQMQTPILESEVDVNEARTSFKNFFTQYDQRRGKNFTATFPRLADWYNSL